MKYAAYYFLGFRLRDKELPYLVMPLLIIGGLFWRMPSHTLSVFS